MFSTKGIVKNKFRFFYSCLWDWLSNGKSGSNALLSLRVVRFPGERQIRPYRTTDFQVRRIAGPGRPWPLLGQDQLALASFPQAIDLTLILDPDFIAAAGDRIELDNLRQHRHLRLRLLDVRLSQNFFSCLFARRLAIGGQFKIRL